MTGKGIRAKANTRGQCVPSLGSDVMKKLGMIWMDKNMKDKAHRGWQTSGEIATHQLLWLSQSLRVGEEIKSGNCSGNSKFT